MTSVRDVPTLQELIVKEAKTLMGVDRVSIFLFDRERCELWSVISQEKKVMRLDARLGIAGKVALTGDTINVADAYDHPLFYKDMDLQTGYRTRTLLAVALRNLKGEVIGVCEAINKNQGAFNDEDIEIIEKGVATGVDHRIGKFEQANGGTLFLDEIGDLSLPAQAKMLRVLQERAVDRLGGKKPVPIGVRIITATNKDLEAAIKERTFRPDLYFRLKVVYVQTPALREVAEDIPLLANHFLAEYCAAAQTELKEFTPAALQCLTRYPWPGNTQELENEVKRLVASVRGKSINEDHLDVLIRSLRKNNQADPEAMVSLPIAVEQLEHRLIEEALRECSGNKQKAAQVLGLSRQGLI